jgi:hypothetical protein
MTNVATFCNTNIEIEQKHYAWTGNTKGQSASEMSAVIISTWTITAISLNPLTLEH